MELAPGNRYSSATSTRKLTMEKSTFCSSTVRPGLAGPTTSLNQATNRPQTNSSETTTGASLVRGNHEERLGKTPNPGSSVSVDSQDKSPEWKEIQLSGLMLEHLGIDSITCGLICGRSDDKHLQQVFKLTDGGSFTLRKRASGQWQLHLRPGMEKLPQHLVAALLNKDQPEGVQYGAACLFVALCPVSQREMALHLLLDHGIKDDQLKQDERQALDDCLKSTAVWLLCQKGDHKRFTELFRKCPNELQEAVATHLMLEPLIPDSARDHLFACVNSDARKWLAMVAANHANDPEKLIAHCPDLPKVWHVVLEKLAKAPPTNLDDRGSLYTRVLVAASETVSLQGDPTCRSLFGKFCEALCDAWLAAKDPVGVLSMMIMMNRFHGDSLIAREACKIVLSKLLENSKDIEKEHFLYLPWSMLQETLPLLDEQHGKLLGVLISELLCHMATTASAAIFYPLVIDICCCRDMILSSGDLPPPIELTGTMELVVKYCTEEQAGVLGACFGEQPVLFGLGFALLERWPNDGLLINMTSRLRGLPADATAYGPLMAKVMTMIRLQTYVN